MSSKPGAGQVYSVYREHPSKKRKNHFGMVFAQQRPLTPSEVEKVVAMIEEVWQKTSGNKKFAV